MLLLLVSDGYVKYEEAEVHRSAIKQDFQGNEKKKLNGRLVAILDFISGKFVMGRPCGIQEAARIGEGFLITIYYKFSAVVKM